MDALSHRGDPSVIPKIESKLADDKEPVRYAAAGAIIHLDDIKTGAAGGKKK